MRKLSLLVLASGLVAFATAQAQTTNQQELPSAPSATLQEQMRREQQQQQQREQQQQQQSAPAQPASTQPAAPANEAATAKATAPPVEAAKSPEPAPTGKGDASNDDPSTFRYVVNANEVNVIFTVTDKHNKFIKDLKQNDFKILDNNQPPKQIRAFHAETDLPLRVGLLVDSSNSVRDRFSFEQEAAIEFLNQIIRPKLDRAFIIGFDTTAEVTQDFTDNTEKLSQGIHALRAGGGTALYDALFYACRDKLQKSADQNSAVRRAIILLSDGEDNQSRVTREEAIEMAQRAEVIIYAISTNVSGVKLHGDKVLERLAEATGGRAFFPFKVQDVANDFSEIQDELRSQYQLAYKPADLQADGRYHSIEIMAENHKNLKVRARKGYFAPKQ
jgi:Ca-activated chloride channel family protein